jgi:hypothetical protein
VSVGSQIPIFDGLFRPNGVYCGLHIFLLGFHFGSRLFLASIYHGSKASQLPHCFLIVLYLSSNGFYFLMVGFHQNLHSLHFDWQVFYHLLHFCGIMI